MSIITGGLGEGQGLILQGFSELEIIILFPAVITLKGTTYRMSRFPVENLDFKINGETHTFTRQLRKDVFEREGFQGFCYACVIEESGTIKITMPLYLTIPRSGGQKPDMRFYFVKWHDIDSYDRVRVVEMESDMNTLIVEYAQKAKEQRRR